MSLDQPPRRWDQSLVRVSLRKTRSLAKRLRTWQNRARKNRPRLPSVIGPYELLSADPVVLYAADPAFNEPDLPVFSILDAAADRPVHVLLAPWWYVGPRF